MPVAQAAVAQAAVAAAMPHVADMATSSALVQKIHSNELRVGDHIYVWRYKTLYAHHGIVVHLNPIGVVHFDQKAVKLTSLNDFLVTKGAAIHKVKYGGYWIESTLKRQGTCSTETPDPPSLVIMRALSLVGDNRVRYDFLQKNCELFAKYCVLGPKKCGVGDFRCTIGAFSGQSSASGILKTVCQAAFVGGAMVALSGELAMAGASAATLAATTRVLRRDDEENELDDHAPRLCDVVEKLFRSFGFDSIPQHLAMLYAANTAWGDGPASTLCEMILDSFDRNENEVTEECEVNDALEKIIRDTVHKIGAADVDQT